MLRFLARTGTFVAALAATLAVGLAQAQSAPPLSGAIFTTLSDGSRVNGNIYSAKCDALGVYLDGGPGPNAPQGAAGLPDGDYYYQVTDPSGKTLLSTDPVKYRRITVTGGIITSRVTPLASGDHQTGVDRDYGANGAIVVELCPFNDTPNNGGEYKVWVTPVDSFSGNPEVVDNGYNPGYFHGFIPAASKTDNFKIKQRTSVCLTVQKFLDNGDGKYSVNEPYVNWSIAVYDPLGMPIQGRTWTGSPPSLQFCALTPGNYKVVEWPNDGASPSYYFPTANILDGRYLSPAVREVIVKIGTQSRTLIFGNTRK